MSAKEIKTLRNIYPEGENMEKQQYIHRLKLIMIFALFIFIFPRNVYAYIDPGSGSFLFQLIIGFLFSNSLIWMI